MVICPLCGTGTESLFFEEVARRYSRCVCCDLIFLHPAGRPLPLDEVVRYLEHENHAASAGYVDFLRTLADPVCKAVPAGAHGLDFGCGPAPVLAALFCESGRPTDSYDPLFHANDVLLTATYDFVTCSEVVEHAHDPAALFGQLMSLVRVGGVLAVMTRMHGTHMDFGTWWYRRDLTHVCFYSVETMQWIARQRACELRLPVANVALFANASTRTPGSD
ncbi:MAG: type 12 methyltransferase [Gemmatimonadetes bacterium]|nr:type 12 methyltransferase [Gemmatimonadota bacterium]